MVRDAQAITLQAFDPLDRKGNLFIAEDTYGKLPNVPDEARHSRSNATDDSFKRLWREQRRQTNENDHGLKRRKLHRHMPGKRANMIIVLFHGALKRAKGGPEQLKPRSVPLRTNDCSRVFLRLNDEDAIRGNNHVIDLSCSACGRVGKHYQVVDRVVSRWQAQSELLLLRSGSYACSYRFIGCHTRCKAPILCCRQGAKMRSDFDPLKNP